VTTVTSDRWTVGGPGQDPSHDLRSVSTCAGATSARVRATSSVTTARPSTGSTRAAS